MSAPVRGGEGARPRATPIVALDVPSLGEARALIEALGTSCRFYKVGTELFTAEGPAAAALVRESGSELFLDLKFHDIPNTVRGAVRSAARLGASLVTAHASGGRAMIEAAADGARAGAVGTGHRCRVLAVTVLTSLDAAALGESWGRRGVEVLNEVLRLSDVAFASGADGIVCSGAEAAQVRARHGEALPMLIPGVRLPGGATHDQARVVTPRAAMAAGATWIVLGRTVTAAADPRAAMDRVLAELS